MPCLIKCRYFLFVYLYFKWLDFFPKLSWHIKVKTYCVEISNWTCWKDSCVKSLFISTVARFLPEVDDHCNQISDYCLNYCHFFILLMVQTLWQAAAGFGTLSITRRKYYENSIEEIKDNIIKEFLNVTEVCNGFYSNDFLH